MPKKHATIYDVAKLASVSLATASRVINNSDKVSPDTKQRVLDAIKELNYQPNSFAVELASKRNPNVAIVVPELNYTYISHVVAGLMEEASDKGYDCLIYTTKRGKADFNKVISKVVSLRPNGIIIFNDSLTDEEIQEVITTDIPIVTLGIDLKTISSVTWHYRNQMLDLISSAMERGKEIYFINMENHGRIENRIIKAIEDAYETKNKKFNNFITVQDSYEEAYEKIKEKIIDLNSAFIIATRDSIALAALNAALDLKKKVPSNIEVMAMMGTKYSAVSRPQLSSFDINMKELGKEGMKTMEEVIENNDRLITKKLPFKFVKRDSTL